MSALTPVARGLLQLHLTTVLADDDGACDAARAVASLASRSDTLDVLALAFVHAGPHGMNAAVTAWRSELAAFDDGPGAARPDWPDGWEFDPAAMHSGIDHGTLVMTLEEGDLLREWYLDAMGEVPGHVRLFLRLQPTNLKTLRIRLERAVHDSLPRQVVPLALLQVALRRGQPDAVRRYRVMSRRFGVGPDQVAEAEELAG